MENFGLISKYINFNDMNTETLNHLANMFNDECLEEAILNMSDNLKEEIQQVYPVKSKKDVGFVCLWLYTLFKNNEYVPHKGERHVRLSSHLTEYGAYLINGVGEEGNSELAGELLYHKEKFLGRFGVIAGAVQRYMKKAKKYPRLEIEALRHYLVKRGSNFG